MSDFILRRRADPLVGSPLTIHDADEQTRQIEGRLYDAREQYSLKPDRETAEQLIHRQDDLIAVLRNQVRQAVS